MACSVVSVSCEARILARSLRRRYCREVGAASASQSQGNVSAQNAVRNVLQNALKEQELSIFTKDDFSRLQSAGFVTAEAFEAVAQDRLFLEQALPGRVAHQAIIARAFAPKLPGGRISSYAHRRIAGVGLAVNPTVNYFVQPDIDTLVDDLQAGCYIVLVGPRQSGKSTAAQALMHRLSNGGVVWPIYLGGLADADSKWTNADMWGTLIRYMRLACPEHFGDAAGADAVAFMSMFQKGNLKTPVCLILDEADSLLHMPTGCLDSFFSTVREVKQSGFNYNLRSFLLIGVETVKDLTEAGYRRTLLEGLRHKEAAAGEEPRRLSPFPHDYTKAAPGFSLDDIVDLLEQVNVDYNGAVQDVQRIALAILGITCGHKGLVGTCLAFILRMRLFTYEKWVEHMDSYELGTYVFGQATYNRIVESFKMRASTPDGYELLIGFLEEEERLCDPIMVRDLLAEGILAVKRVDTAGQCYVGISSPLLLTAMLRECEIKSERVEAPPKANVVDRKWLMGKVVQTINMKVVASPECQNKSGPAEYALQFAFMCRLKALLRQAYPLVPLIVLPEVKEMNGTQDQRSQRRLDTLVRDGSRFGFEFLVHGDQKTLSEYLERAKIYHGQHLAHVFLTNFSMDIQAEELRPDHDGITFVGVAFDSKAESVTLRFLDCNGCKDDVKLAMKSWDGRITF